MKKKKEEIVKEEISPGGNHHQTPAEVTEIIESFRKEAADVIQEMKDVAERRDGTGQAALFIAKSILNTPRERLPELTRLYLRSVRPCSLADMSSSVFDPYVQAGIITLGQVRRDSVYRHMRSVGGDLLNKAKDLAEEQLRVSESPESFEGADVGKGL